MRLRGDWTSDVEVKILAEGDNANTLFWVGCTGALVERNVKATLSMTEVMKAAGVDFAVLCDAETCFGDPARRAGRHDRGQLRAIPPETAALIERLKRESPSRTGAALLNHLALADPNQQQPELSPSTLYRFLRARGLTERQLLLDQAAASTHKKYEAEFANQTWQSDMLFGPWVQRSGGGQMQVFLQATLDDASRLIGLRIPLE